MAPGLPAIAASVRSIPLLSVLAAVFAGAAIALIRVIRKKEAGAGADVSGGFSGACEVPAGAVRARLDPRAEADGGIRLPGRFTPGTGTV